MKEIDSTQTKSVRATTNLPGDAQVVRLEYLPAVGDAGAAPQCANRVVEAAVEEEGGGGDAAEEPGRQQPVQETCAKLLDMLC